MTTFSRRAELRWDGELLAGSGEVTAGTGAFAAPVRFPSVARDPPGKSTPEELLAASHAACYGIGLRSVIGRSGGRAQRVTVEAVISAEKGPDGIRIQSSHLAGVVDARLVRCCIDFCNLLVAAHERMPTQHAYDDRYSDSCRQ